MSKSMGNDFEDDDYDFEDDDFQDDSCHFCGGDGEVVGSELGDPFWYASNESYQCPSCRGSGYAKDCTFW